jgi:Right handed beta helix region
MSTDPLKCLLSQTDVVSGARGIGNFRYASGNLRGILWWRLAVLIGLGLTSAAGADLYVSPGGNDGNPGTLGAPFASITRARDAIRAFAQSGGLPAGGVTVWLRGGYYNLASPIIFDGRDAGTEAKPIVYTAWPGEQVNITGGRSLDPAAFTLVTSSSPIWSRLDPAARGQVYEINLWSRGITDLGTLKPRGYHLPNTSALELFINGRPMTLARWPNRDQPLARTVGSNTAYQMNYAGSRPERWGQARDIWMEGFWGSTYADFHLPVAMIDPSSKTVQFASQPSTFGIGANRSYFAYNLLEEIDQPGEYYVDRSTGMLYVWPTSLPASSILVSMVEDTLLQFYETNYVTLRDLVIETSRGALVRIDSGSQNRLERCVLRNAGQHAVSINGWNNGLDQCTIADAGESGVLLQGGIRASLTRAYNFVTNCVIERTGRIAMSYFPGIDFRSGCGNKAIHNLLRDMPHSAILFSGNDHLIEYNEITRVCEFTSDAGAVYSGRDWGYRGNVIRYNFFHHLWSQQEGNGVSAIYLDDGLSGVDIFGNVFYDIQDAAIFCGGGRDNLMRNNIMAHCLMGHFNGDYARSTFNNVYGSDLNLLWRLTLDGVQYQQNPWASAYPALAAIPNDFWTLQNGLWFNPQNCVFDRNAGWSNVEWMFETNFSGTGVFSVYASIANNNPNHAELFGEAASLDRSQRPATLTAAISGFVPISFQAIGPDLAARPAATLVPSAPWVEITGQTAASVNLQWFDSGNLAYQEESGFELQQRLGANGSWQPVRSYGSETSTAATTGLAASTLYGFRIRAFNAQGSDYSNEISTTTAAAPLIPGPSTRFEAENALTVLADVGDYPIAVSNGVFDSGNTVHLFDSGDTVRVTFNVPTTGNYRLGVRVRAGDASVPPKMSFWPLGYKFKVDGNEVTLLGDPDTLSALENTYGPTYWGTMYSGPVPLTAGVHSIDVMAVHPWGLLDYVESAPLSGSTPPIDPGPTPNPPPPSGATVRLEAEAPLTILSDIGGNGAVHVVNAALDSGSSVSLFDHGDAVRMFFDVATTDAFRLAVRVRSGDGSGSTAYWPSGYTFQLDGQPIILQPDAATLSALETSIGPTYWGTMYTQGVVLSPGRHSIDVTAVRDWAAVDYLEVTASGNSPPPPPLPTSPPLVPTTGTALRLEVESPLTVVGDVGPNGAVGVGDAQLDSGQCVSLFDRGDGVRVTFDAPTAGTYRIAARVRSGDATSPTAYWPSGYLYRIDGNPLVLTGEPGSVSPVESAFGPTYWGTMAANDVTLAAGTHTFDLSSARDWAVADYAEVSLLPATPPPPPPDPNPVVRIEAEAPLNVVTDVGVYGQVGLGNAQLDSGMCVALFDRGDAIRFYFDVPSAGNYRIAARVRSGDASGPTAYWPNGYVAKLDGNSLVLQGDVTTVSAVEGTFGPTYWGSMTVDVAIATAGQHWVDLVSARDWALADYLEVTRLSATPPPGGYSPIRIEAESPLTVVNDGGSLGPVMASNGYLDSGLNVTLFDRGDAVAMSVNVPSTGRYRISVRVRSGDGAGATTYWPDGYRFTLGGVPLVLSGNPTTISAVDTVYGPTYWGTMSAEVSDFTAGVHTVSVVSNREWAAVDFLEVVRID